ncbi:ATP-binding protein [Sphingomonas sp. OK281]|uniref:ATP-binding protein n=1 Tax=Sphingomonas sp. OK281 TaxID=1881067 RepID=UPI0008F0DF8C|nr:ATP-binding protein [Sphingomonas sp. OK281]SFO30290.1 Histidine kinase-, DNA gyrase B-, and HSP90-like ATPase [Sphingomonas sp. OK281]
MQEYEDAPPPADALSESLRGFGYSVETALADIIDNSITARAKNVRVTLSLGGASPFVLVLDDGNGMDEPTLRDAMRLGSQNPLTPRDSADLGRFGLGLKTASFSQARSLTVASKRKKGGIAVRRWDLDYLASNDGEWRLLTTAPEDAVSHLEELEQASHGTVVLWSKLDRVRPRAGHSPQGGSHILMGQIENHLAMVFHRYLEGPQPRLKLYVNGARIEPWDPFLSTHKACRPTPEETLGTGENRIRVKGFVLPAKDMIGDAADFEKAGGNDGWITHQGFYIYRNDRLLVAGGWLGLGVTRPWVRDETHKLARIRIDLPNSADAAWQIDVKKSDASPPENLRNRLRDLAMRVRSDARSVFVHRGEYGKRAAAPNLARPWKAIRIGGQSAYRIDRSHPLASYILQQLNDDDNSVETFLRLVEETVPIERIWIDTVEQGEFPAPAFSGETREQIRQLARDLLASLVNGSGMTAEKARAHLRRMPPFDQHADILDEI